MAFRKEEIGTEEKEENLTYKSTLKVKSPEELPQRNEYITGGLYGLRHIIVNYYKDGSVVRTINGVDETYATQEEFYAACEAAYQEYLDWLDKW